MCKSTESNLLQLSEKLFSRKEQQKLNNVVRSVHHWKARKGAADVPFTQTYGMLPCLLIISYPERYFSTTRASIKRIEAAVAIAKRLKSIFTPKCILFALFWQPHQDSSFKWGRILPGVRRRARSLFSFNLQCPTKNKQQQKQENKLLKRTHLAVHN